MTKTSGRKVKCMACGTFYNHGKGDHRPCPGCTGEVAIPKPAHNNKYAHTLKSKP